MKIIISHDLDHLNVSEHFNDLIVPKFILRAKIELLTGKISIKEFLIRMSALFLLRWNRIDEIVAFNKLHNIPTTFFVGVNKGLGLNYSLKNAAIAIKKMQSLGCDVGVHGISYDNFDAVKNEFELFAKIIGHRNFGIRMHYLRTNADTLKHLSDAGYLFDATMHKFESTYHTFNFTEFPVHIMDGWMINNHKSWQANNLQQALDESKRLIDQGVKNKVDYFSILFHDRYFTNGFRTWKSWYTQLMEYLIQNNFQFTDYKSALADIKEKSL